MMKKSLRLIFASFTIIGGMALVSFAQEGNNRHRGINERQHNQQKRIWDGVQDDELNKKEFRRLEMEQSQIRRQERRFKSDGDFTKVERARVQHNQNQASRHIHRAKNN